MIFLFVTSRLIDLIATIMYRIIVIYKINDFYAFVFVDNISYLSITLVASINFFIRYHLKNTYSVIMMLWRIYSVIMKYHFSNIVLL